VAPQSGESAVVVPVAAAEAVVSQWRERFDTSAAQGMPAHVTALYPFLPAPRLGARAVERLRHLCAQLPALEVAFRRTARFPDVLYLAPEPPDGLRRLTLAIAQEWPQTPPYGGRFAEIVPHLTVAHAAPEAAVAEVARIVADGLPFTATLTEAELYVFDGTRWRLRTRLPFGPLEEASASRRRSERTGTGLAVPVPTRGEFFSALRSAAEPEAPPTSGV
jgi:hypothetical protein